MSFSLNANSGTKVLAQTAVALAAAVSLSGCGSTAPAHTDQLALTVINNLASGNVAAATTDFSPAMTKGLPAENLAQTWKHYQDVLGNYQSHGQPNDVAQGPLTVVNLPLSMAKKPGQLRITVDEGGHVAGLFLLE